MAQLYFTSSLIPNKLFLSLEELFEHIKHQEILLVFDTNIVVYYRDFFLNSNKFITSNKSTYYSIRYLVEQISRYDLEVNGTFGVEESSRSKSDFKLNMEKVYQTHRAVMSILAMNIDSFDKFIKEDFSEDEIKTNKDYPFSKIDSLKEESSFQNLHIISYLAALKIFILKNQIEENTITPSEAYLFFLDFVIEEVDCIAATINQYALHLFGGVDFFKLILMPKGNISIEETLDQLFTGAIDLVYPTIVNKSQDLYPIPNKLEKMIPVLVTADRRLATLHSRINTKFILETSSIKDGINYNPELTEIVFYEKTKWSKADLKLFNDRLTKDIEHRFISSISEGKTATHLLPLVEKYEQEVITIVHNKLKN